MTCPGCGGRRTTQVYVSLERGRGLEGEWQWWSCSVCRGRGEITEAERDRIDWGLQRRLSRLGRGLSLAQEARRLGMTAAELSRREAGRER